MKPEIKVSVCVVTYNQEKYIADCLKSLVKQDTDFSYEIIVCDDNSNDETPSVIRAYQKEYPNLIIPIFNTTNVGAVKNMMIAYQAARGQYIAHMDGDDCALPGKLQKQASILDENEICFFCTHEVMAINQNNEKVRESWSDFSEGIYGISDLYKTLPFFAHSSKMFRNDTDADYYKKFTEETLDIEIHIEHANIGKIYHLSECNGCYRVFSGVSYSQKKINPLIPAANKRIYEAALMHGVDDLTKKDLRRAYATSLLKFSLQSIYLNCANDANKYAKESLKVKVFSLKQFLFYLVSLSKLSTHASIYFSSIIKSFLKPKSEDS